MRNVYSTEALKSTISSVERNVDQDTFRSYRSEEIFSGKIESPTRRDLSTPGVKGVRDVERGLSLDLPVVVYTNDQETKSFLEQEALKLAPGLKRRSGSRYRLNRWREEQLIKGAKLTYGKEI